MPKTQNRKQYPKSYKKLFTPKHVELTSIPKLIDGEVLRYFVILGTNRLPAQIHIAVFKDGIKKMGHKLIPNELTDKTFGFASLQDMDKYVCPCGKSDCQYTPYLKICIANFRKQMINL